MTRQKSIVLVASLMTLFSWSEEEGFIKRLENSMKAKFMRKDSLINAGKPFICIFAGPGYTPESRLLIGGGLL